MLKRLKEAGEAVLAMETEPGGNAEKACRFFQSIKAEAVTKGWSDLEEVIGSAEAVLKGIIEGKSCCDSITVSFLIMVIDVLKEGIAGIRDGKGPRIAGKDELIKRVGKFAVVPEESEVAVEKKVIIEAPPVGAGEARMNIKGERRPGESGRMIKQQEVGTLSANQQLDIELIEEEEDEDTQEDKYLTFLLAREEYGIEIRYVTEIIGIQRVTTVPDMPMYVKGVINLRGKVIPVMDVRLRFGIKEREYDDRTCIVVINVGEHLVGLIVDRVSEVLDIPKGDIEPPPSTREGGNSRFVQGMGKAGERVIILLSAKRLLFDESDS